MRPFLCQLFTMTDNSINPIVGALQSDNPAEAERQCRQLLMADAEAADVLVLLAVSQWRLGRHELALEIYARLAEAHPDEILHWRNYANALWESGDLSGAEHAFTRAAALAPDDAELLEHLGLVQLDAGKAADARNTLLRAFGKSPVSPAIRIHAARACSLCRDSRADHLLSPWRDWLPLDDSLQSELAEVQAQLGEAVIAVELLEDLAHRLPEERRVRLRLASLYERINRVEQAERLLDEIAAGTEPAGREACEIARQRAQLAMRRRDYAAARALLDQAGPSGDGDYGFWFALGNACDKAGDPEAAMGALERAHARQLDELRPAVPDFFEPGAEVLPKVSARVSAGDYRNWPQLQAPDAAQSPVFVVGFPRSGTTLLEQMLDAHPRMQSMDERPLFNTLSRQLEAATGIEVPHDLGRLNQRDCDELRKGYLLMACAKIERRWDAQLVDKNPLNMLWLPLIHRMFPHARFILAVRHPCDVLLSCYMQNFRTAVLAVAGQSLERLAQAYVAAMETWLHHVDVFKPSVMVSRYEDLVADTPSQLGRIASFLGLENASAMLDFDTRAREKGYIKTPSYTQVIEPINTRGVGRWQQYFSHFAPALPLLKPMLERWGYGVDW